MVRKWYPTTTARNRPLAIQPGQHPAHHPYDLPAACIISDLLRFQRCRYSLERSRTDFALDSSCSTSGRFILDESWVIVGGFDWESLLSSIIITNAVRDCRIPYDELRKQVSIGVAVKRARDGVMLHFPRLVVFRSGIESNEAVRVARGKDLVAVKDDVKPRRADGPSPYPLPETYTTVQSKLHEPLWLRRMAYHVRTVDAAVYNWGLVPVPTPSLTSRTSTPSIKGKSEVCDNYFYIVIRGTVGHDA